MHGAPGGQPKTTPISIINYITSGLNTTKTWSLYTVPVALTGANASHEHSAIVSGFSAIFGDLVRAHYPRAFRMRGRRSSSLERNPNTYDRGLGRPIANGAAFSQWRGRERQTAEDPAM